MLGGSSCALVALGILTDYNAGLETIQDLAEEAIF